MQYFYKTSTAKSVLRIPVPHNNHDVAISIRHVAAWPLNGLIGAAVAVPFVAWVEGGMITTDPIDPTKMVVVTALPLVTVLVLAPGLDDTGTACGVAGELGVLVEAIELKMERGVTLETGEMVGLEGVEGEAAKEDGETKRSAVLPEGVGEEKDGEEDGEEGLKTEVGGGGGLELTVEDDDGGTRIVDGVVDATIVVVLAAAAVMVVVVVEPPSRSGNRVGPFVLVEVTVKIVADTTVV